jgi:hypothetical protein
MTFCVGFDLFFFGCFLILAFFLLAKFRPKREIQNVKKKSEFLSFQSPEVRKNRSNRQFLYLVFIG